MKTEDTITVQTKIEFDAQKYMMGFILLAIWIIFTILTSGVFFSPRNMSNLIRQMTFTAILAAGMMNVIVIGQIDLSVGSLVGLSGGVFAIMNSIYKVPLIPAILVTLGMCLAIGIWNGWWVAYMNVPSFIATLSGMLIFRGILVGITGGKTIAPMDKALQWIGAEYMSNTVGFILASVAAIILIGTTWVGRRKKVELQLEVRSVWIDISQCILIVALTFGFVVLMNAYRGIPQSFYLLLILFAIYSIMTRKTIFGRRMYAIGGNRQASLLAGINVKKNTLMVFALNGLTAGIASIYLCARLDSAAVSAGTNGELDAIASCVIGGVSMVGGVGTLSGVIIGATVMATIDNGMALLNTPAFWQTIIKGLVLLIAVWFDMSKKKN